MHTRACTLHLADFQHRKDVCSQLSFLVILGVVLLLGHRICLIALYKEQTERCVHTVYLAANAVLPYCYEGSQALCKPSLLLSELLFVDALFWIMRLHLYGDCHVFWLVNPYVYSYARLIVFLGDSCLHVTKILITSNCQSSFSSQILSCFLFWS
jgi:hypothetical protein